MKQRYTIGQYVSILQHDKLGSIRLLIAEAEMPRKVVVGRELRARPCQRGAEWVSLGVVCQVRNYKKRSYVEVLTDKGYYALEVNKGVESIMTDVMNIDEL